ncbi:MAG TPA: PHB depolymerase family esterase [Kiritimatiellia bacterium]|nr:PHB depolymerase family esterase [Kiritimatiellia bacterium]HMO99606.1 PHB depolymerase family esterase [Kiritimatiellia bacterium]HMP97238.1 PHB depolymerase family esterase [Kiritimatiellia bacterium]
MSGRQEVRYVEWDGLSRRYVLFRPDAVVLSGERVPAIVMLDGRGGTPWTAMRSSQWNAKADREGFVVLYPEATRMDPDGPLHFLTNPQMWNAGAGGSDVERPPVDDAGFLRAALEDAASYARIDPARVYMTGFSNGAAMTYRFAVAHPDRLAAIAPVAGHFRLQNETLPEPIPMISFFGKRDPLSPVEGGEVQLPWGRRETRPPAVSSVRAWATLCGHHPDDGVEEYEPGLSRLKYGRRGERDEIEFIVVDDLGHTWPGGHRLLPESLVGPTSDRVNGNDEIWDFFRRHRR